MISAQQQGAYLAQQVTGQDPMQIDDEAFLQHVHETAQGVLAQRAAELAQAQEPAPDNVLNAIVKRKQAQKEAADWADHPADPVPPPPPAPQSNPEKAGNKGWPQSRNNFTLLAQAGNMIPMQEALANQWRKSPTTAARERGSGVLHFLDNAQRSGLPQDVMNSTIDAMGDNPDWDREDVQRFINKKLADQDGGSESGD